MMNFNQAKLSNDVVDVVDVFVKSIFGFNRMDIGLNKRSERNMTNLYSCIPTSDLSIFSLLVGLSHYLNEYQINIKRDNSFDECLICGIGFKKMLVGYSFCNKLLQKILKGV